MDVDNKKATLQANLLSKYDAYFFTFDETVLAEKFLISETEYNLMHFKKSSAVAVEICMLIYNLLSNFFKYSLQLQEVYHFGKNYIIEYLP